MRLFWTMDQTFVPINIFKKAGLEDMANQPLGPYWTRICLPKWQFSVYYIRIQYILRFLPWGNVWHKEQITLEFQHMDKQRDIIPVKCYSSCTTSFIKNLIWKHIILVVKDICHQPLFSIGMNYKQEVMLILCYFKYCIIFHCEWQND